MLKSILRRSLSLRANYYTTPVTPSSVRLTSSHRRLPKLSLGFQSKSLSSEAKGEGPPTEAAEEKAPDQQTDENSKIEKLENSLKDMKDRVLRSLAEEENVRRIAKRDVDNAKAYANSSFAKALLEVADNLELALAAAKNNNSNGTAGANSKKDPMDIRTGEAADGASMLKNLLEGVEATNRGLLKAFAQFGIVKYGAVGEKFDPTLHDALFQVPDDTKEQGSIAQVLQHGYKLKDRVLRAAQVGTSVKKS